MNEIYGRVPGGEKYLSLPLICGLAKNFWFDLLRFFLTKVSDVLSVNGTSKVRRKKDISMNSVLY